MLELVAQPKLLSHPPKDIAEGDHERLLLSYFQSYRVRNFSPRRIEKEEHFLETWFLEHELLTWQAMESVTGRKRVTDYANALIETGISTATVRSYLGILRRYFSYVLEFPFVGVNPVRRIQEVYGPIDQPVRVCNLFCVNGESFRASTAPLSTSI